MLLWLMLLEVNIHLRVVETILISTKMRGKGQNAAAELKRGVCG